MKTGIELIAIERQEQIEKHERTVQTDVDFNGRYELMTAAKSLLFIHLNAPEYRDPRPTGWDRIIWNKMVNKDYKERLIIAGALIAAELDRINKAKDRPSLNFDRDPPVMGDAYKSHI